MRCRCGMTPDDDRFMMLAEERIRYEVDDRKRADDQVLAIRR